MWFVLQSCSSRWDAWYWHFDLARKAFLSTIFLIIKVHSWNEANLVMEINLHKHLFPSILFFIGIIIMFSTLVYAVLKLWICKKAFLFTIFPIINVHPWNEIILDTRNNLHSFCYAHHNYVFLIEIHDIDALDLQQKLFFPPFSL